MHIINYNKMFLQRENKVNMGGEEGKKRRKWRQFLEGTKDLSPLGIMINR